jgi:hypothetical protein
MTTEIQPTRVAEFIKQMMPWAHGHQIKAITKFVLAIIDKQTGCQAELARTQGNQEAAVKQLSRLIHNPRLKPKDFAKWLCLQVLANQVPRRGKVRLTIDWTTEEGFRDAKWYLGFAESRVTEIDAWSRLFALFAIALLVLTTLGIALLIRGGTGANQFLRRVASRRSGRCELSLVSAMIALVQKDRSLFAALSPQTKLNLEATLSNVS